MKRYALLSLFAAAGLLGTPPAEAKFRMWLTVGPKPLWAKQPARVIVRTGIELPRNHSLLLHVVGPGSLGWDTAFFEPRLRRIGPRAFAATVRFPRGGRWRLIVPNWNASGSTSPPPVDRAVRVRPSP